MTARSTPSTGEHGRDDGQDGKADGGGSRDDAGRGHAHEVRGDAGGTHGGLSGGLNVACRLDGRAAVPPVNLADELTPFTPARARFEGQVACGASQLGR